MTPEEETFNHLKEPAPEIDKRGVKRWRNNSGRLHRDNDLPAVVYLDGTMFWYVNGKLHRDNGLPKVLMSHPFN